MKKFMIIMLAMLVALSVLVTGCSSFSGEVKEEDKVPVEDKKKDEQVVEKKEESKEKNENETEKVSGKVQIVGSTSVQPLAQAIADEFEKKFSEISIEVQGVGSSAGVKAAADGVADIGSASRELKEKEEAWGLDKHIIAFDGVAVVAHRENSLDSLSKEDITKIFKGEIKNWSEVGGNDEAIIVVSRESGSGTRGAFEDIMDLEVKDKDGNKVSAVREDALIQEGNGSVRATISTKKSAIGYISLGYVNEEVKALDVDGVAASKENIKAQTYPVFRPFLMLTKGEVSPATKAYLDYIFSDEGQKIVSKKYIEVK